MHAEDSEKSLLGAHDPAGFAVCQVKCLTVKFLYIRTPEKLPKYAQNSSAGPDQTAPLSENRIITAVHLSC